MTISVCYAIIIEIDKLNFKEKLIMACFLVSTAEAIAVTAIEKKVEKKEISVEQLSLNNENHDIASEIKIPFSRKLKWLRNMLWGGSILLLFEHIWHGEIVPWFPFLTAAANHEDTMQMLHEMATVGVAMAIAVTVVWGVMIALCHVYEKRMNNEKSATEGENV